MSVLSILFEKQGASITDIKSIPEELMNAVLRLIISFLILSIPIFMICVIFRGMVNISLGCSPFSGRVKEVKKKKGEEEKRFIFWENYIKEF